MARGCFCWFLLLFVLIMWILNWEERKNLWKCIGWYWGEGMWRKGLYQRVCDKGQKKYLLKRIRCLECHGSWLQLFSHCLLMPRAVGSPASPVARMSKLGITYAGVHWPSCEWTGLCSSLRGNVVLNTIVNGHLYILPTGAVGPGGNITFSCLRVVWQCPLERVAVRLQDRLSACGWQLRLK